MQPVNFENHSVLARIRAGVRPSRAAPYTHLAGRSPVAQTSSLLYRGFPIRQRCEVSQALPTGRRRAEAALWRAAKAESRRHSRWETVGNLRYFRLTKCV